MWHPIEIILKLHDETKWHPIEIILKLWELLWCQPFRHPWHWRFSFWHLTAYWRHWQLSVFSVPSILRQCAVRSRLFSCQSWLACAIDIRYFGSVANLRVIFETETVSFPELGVSYADPLPLVAFRSTGLTCALHWTGTDRYWTGWSHALNHDCHVWQCWKNIHGMDK